MNKHKKKEITKETVIIVGLVFFIIGYAVNGIIGSIDSFFSEPNLNKTVISEIQNSNINTTKTQIDFLKEKLDINPEDTASWEDLGNAYFDTDRFSEAIDAYLRALELKPDNPDILSDLGVMYRRSGKPRDAIAAFDEARRIDPNHTMSLFNKGIVQFYDLEQKNKAIETWKILSSIDQNFRMPTGELMTDFLGAIK